MAQPTMLDIQFGPFICAKGQRIQFAHLPLKLFALTQQGIGTVIGQTQVLLGFTPTTENRTQFAHLAGQAGMGIEQLTLGVSAQ